MYAPDHVLHLAPLQQRLQPLQIQRGDIIRLGANEQINPPLVLPLQAMRLRQVLVKRPLEVGGRQVGFFRVQILRAVPRDMFAEAKGGEAACEGGEDGLFEGCVWGCVAAELAGVGVVGVHRWWGRRGEVERREEG